MKGELERFIELALTRGPRQLWRERDRHGKSVRFVATRQLQDEPWHPETRLPPGVAIENFKPQGYQPELVKEGDADYWLWAGMAGAESLVVDIPRECFDRKTGRIDPAKALVFIAIENGKHIARALIDETALIKTE